MGLVMRFIAARFCLVIAVFIAGQVLLPQTSRALELNQAIENCRNSSGRPAYMACRQSGGTHEACFSRARSIVGACAKSAMIAAHPKAPLFSADKLSTVPVPAQPDPGSAKSGAPALVAPPRNVDDITAILDQQKPDPTAIATQAATADEPVPANLKGPDLAAFYYKRAQARTLLGRADALDDAELAVSNEAGADYANLGSRYEQLLMRRLRDVGQHKRANALLAKQLSAFAKQKKGKLFGLHYAIAVGSLRNGDLGTAESYVAKNRALLAEAQRWPVFPVYGMSWQALVEDGNARVDEARGRYPDAEAAYHKASIFYLSALKTVAQWESKPSEGELERFSDWALALEGRVKVKQGRVGEGEADVRRALLSRLSKSGKFHADTAGVLEVLVYVLQEQGRYAEAERLQREVIAIFAGLGYATDSAQLVHAQLFLAQILNMERNYAAAARLYDQIDALTAKWEPARRAFVSGGLARVSVLLMEGKAGDALDIAQRSYERERQRSGDNSLNTLTARGFVAIAEARANNTSGALTDFRAVIPALLSSDNPPGDDDSGATAAAQEGRVRLIIEIYLRVLSRNPSLATAAEIDQTFGYADVLRGQAVQRALQASSLRERAKDSALAELVRSAQDSEKEIGAAVGTLNNLLSLPASERDGSALARTQAEIARLKQTRSQTLQQIAKKFPEYSSLTRPPLSTPSETQKLLRDDEVILSFYFGRFSSFLWVLSRDKAVQFSSLDTTLGDVNATVAKLRESLEPNAAIISDIPPFDLKRAYGLYSTLLKPSEADWKPAKNLIVITNGALGLLPMSLLPTAPSEVDQNDDPLFSSYRKVPWLARTHAVTSVPSTSSLVTLRKLPAVTSQRQEFVGFGDPIFSRQQLADEADTSWVQEASASGTTRGVMLKLRNKPNLEGVESAQLGMLPRLPDTAEELRSIALALHADPEVLNLGKDANERKVETSDLSNVKVIAFATHGLLPGDLDGLTQPALALSAPSVADIDGDGLLTMDEILSLKLNADWVVLSACNSGSAASAGAEAASGLGRAFFYAGTRALLVTNWSVHSQSARELVTDLFRRQAQDKAITRGEALRQAMMAMVDGPGYVNGGKTEFSYAHPLFWAPYSIIGDGGAR